VHEKASGDTSRITAESFGGGVYWRGVLGRLSANARVGADYVKLSSDRAVAITNVTSAIFGATASSRWSGSEVAARAHLAYDADVGPLYLRPQASFDYVKLDEDGRTETGGGAVDLALDARASSRSSAFAGLAIGKTFGDDATWGPELLVGYRDVVSEKLADTTARFVSGGDTFTVPAEAIGGQGFVARVAFKGENGYGGFALEGGAESRDGLTLYDVRLAAHVQF
jgi:outer membrane autotransporter protein